MARGRFRIGYPGVDDMTLDEINAAPIIRSTVRGNKWPGVIEGTGLDSAARQQNLVSIQAAIDYCEANNNILEFDSGNYEIEGADGMVIRQASTGFVWRAPLTATFHQATSNAPILTIGSTGAGSGQSDTFGIDLNGASLHYLSDQSGNTNANALVLGNLWLCRIGGLRVGSTITNFRSYRGIYMPSGLSFFSNTLEDIKVFRSVQSLMHIGNFGTGNRYDNIYLSGVTPAGIAGAVNSPFYWQQISNQQMHDSVFNQLNIEWCIALNLMTFNNVKGASFNSVHIEQNRLTGAHPCVVSANISNVCFDGLTLLDNRYESSIASGNPSFLKSVSDSAIHVTNMPVVCNSASYVDMDIFAIWQGTDREDNPGAVTVENYHQVDGSGTSLKDHVQPDVRMNFATYGNPRMTKVGRIESGEPVSRMKRAQLELTGSYTLYGVMAEDAFIRYPATLSAASTLTLSNVMGPAGSNGSGVIIPAGTIVAVRRRNGTIANDLVIENHDGTDLVTSTTSATTYRFKFDGTDWSLIT